MPEKKKKEHEPEQPKAQASETAPEQKEDGKQVSASEELSAEQLQQQIEELNKKLQEQEEQLKEQSDRLLRTLAEYDNYRKRSQKEKENAWTTARADTIKELLPVYDNLERALKQETADEAYAKGVQMTMTQLKTVLEKLGVEEIPAQGESFDPNVHNAVMHMEDEALGENTVVEVFQAGFKMGEKVIRHAMVKVAN